MKTTFDKTVMDDNQDFTFSLAVKAGTYTEFPNPAVNYLKKITIDYIDGDIGNELHEIKHGYHVMKGDLVYSIIDGLVC